MRPLASSASVRRWPEAPSHEQRDVAAAVRSRERRGRQEVLGGDLRSTGFQTTCHPPARGSRPILWPTVVSMPHDAPLLEVSTSTVAPILPLTARSTLNVSTARPSPASRRLTRRPTNAPSARFRSSHGSGGMHEQARRRLDFRCKRRSPSTSAPSERAFTLRDTPRARTRSPRGLCATGVSSRASRPAFSSERRLDEREVRERLREVADEPACAPGRTPPRSDRGRCGARAAARRAPPPRRAARCARWPRARTSTAGRRPRRAGGRPRRCSPSSAR